jgi:hypothetical protein
MRRPYPASSPVSGGIAGVLPTIPNPVGIPVLTESFFVIPALVYFTLLLLAASSLLVRFRRARGDQRQQLKWVAFAAVLFGVVGLVGPRWLADSLRLALGLLAALAFNGAIAIAILKYRLYEIDRLLNRTLVYGLLTALLAAVYAVTVLVLGQLFGGLGAKPPSWAMAGTTLAVAALFQPGRRRIQHTVDRRSIGAATTPLGRWKRSARVCAIRSTWTPSRSNSSRWLTRPCSRAGSGCGFGPPRTAPRAHPAVRHGLLPGPSNTPAALVLR